MLAFFDTAETASLLRAIAPACKDPDGWAPHLSNAMFRFGIGNDLNFVAAFIAQVLVESDELTRVAENLNYSADRLCAVWAKRFPTRAAAEPYAHNPRELAIRVYGGRLGNAAAPSDDGYVYRGRGCVQTTGRANYQRLQVALGIPFVRKPELLEERANSALGAAWYWWEHKLSFLAADRPDDDDNADLLTITRRVNGGEHGLARRRAYWLKARAHLGLPNVEE
jgi:putative chitinase